MGWNQREKIEAILTDGSFEPDTRLVENAILYPLLENCKIHGLKPEQYLCETIEAINRLGSGATADEIAALTPSRIAASRKAEAEAA